jgi:transcriptional regulator with GAF, ATPase, and Fis domain
MLARIMPEPKRSTLARVGDAAKRSAQRELLLATLERTHWNLSQTADDLGLSSPSDVLRAVAELDLSAELEAARASGLVSRQSRRT